MKKKFRSNFSKQNNKIQNCKRFSIDFLLNNISTIFLSYLSDERGFRI